MKRFYIFFIAAILACACQKSPVETISGSYSFKNGGVLEILGKLPAIDGILPERDTVIKSSLIPESGQMRILPKGENEVVVTMNVTGGNPVVFNGVVSDGKITLSPVERKISILNEFCEAGLPADALVSVDGVGTIYGNTLIFDMSYKGNFYIRDIPCKILFSNVKCVANRNE